jgi:hypothetical protein
MSLKDTWVDLSNALIGEPDSGSDITVEPINEIAHAVIALEENGSGSSIEIDAEMSDASENAVQNKVIKAYVDGITGDISTALDELHAYAQALKDGGAE